MQPHKRPFQIYGILPTGGKEILLNDISNDILEASINVAKLESKGCKKLRILTVKQGKI